MCTTLYSFNHFIQFSGQEIGALPVRGFIGLNTLRREAVLLYNSIEETARQQRILPSMNFSCSGNISKWTFVARSRIGGGREQYLQFQLWRPSRTGRYERVYESSDMSGQSEFTVEEYIYIPDDPVPFEAGYIFGVYQPQLSRRGLSVVYVDVPVGYGYPNYDRRNGMSLEEFDIDGSTVGNNYPLVAVNTSECQKTLSDKQRHQPLSKIFLRYRAADTARVHAYQCAGSGDMHPQKRF